MGKIAFLPGTTRKTDDAPQNAHRPHDPDTARLQRDWRAKKFDMLFRQILALEFTSLRVNRKSLFLYFVCPDRAARKHLWEVKEQVNKLLRKVRSVYSGDSKWRVSNGELTITPGISADFPPKGVPHYMMCFRILNAHTGVEYSAGVSYELGANHDSTDDVIDDYLADDDEE
jgi:hypothetical protein